MALINCPECGEKISDKAFFCPRCGYSIQSVHMGRKEYWGYEWRSETEFLGLPLVHIAIGRNKKTGRLLVARGIIAIGQFGLGLVTITQFGIGFLFCFSQAGLGMISIGQVAIGIYFGLGQIATGITVIGQLAIGQYVLAQMGFGEHVWSVKVKDPVAMEYFRGMWMEIKFLFESVSKVKRPS